MRGKDHKKKILWHKSRIKELNELTMHLKLEQYQTEKIECSEYDKSF